MALAANALVTLEQARTALKLTLADQDAAVETAINAASTIAEAWCNRLFKRRALTDLRLRGVEGTVLDLPATPIALDEPISVRVNQVVQTVWRTEEDGDPDEYDVMIAGDAPGCEDGRANHLYRPLGWASSRTGQPYNVVVSYTGGFDPIPADLAEACLYIVGKLFRDRTKQTADITSITGPSGSVQVLDIVIPRLAQRLLEHYRHVVIG